MNHPDHEIEMARSELYSIAKYAIALHEMLENVSELDGMEGWQQSKITRAADYMESVYQSLTHEMKFGESAPKGWEGTVKAMKKHKEIDNPWALAHYMKNKGYKSHKKEEGVAEAGYGRNKDYDPGFASPHAPKLTPIGGPKQDDEYVNGNPVNNIEVSINGRPWKIFPGKGPDGSRAFFQQKQDVDEMCKRKTAATGKKWSWGVTGEPATNESTVQEHKKGVRAMKHTTKPRNPVMAGDKPGKATVTHKNKKKDQQRGVEKHKGKEPAYESRLWNALSQHLEK